MLKNLKLGGVMLASLMMAASCQNDEIISNEQQKGNYSLKVSSLVDSRTYVEDDGTVKWSKDDKLYVYGEGVSGVLTLNDADAGKDEGTFTGFVFGNPDNLQWAVFGDEVKGTADGAEFTISTVEGENSNSPMVGEIIGGNVEMEHLCGMVRITINKLPEGAKVKLSGTGIAGTAEWDGTSMEITSAADEISINVGSGNQTIEVPVFATETETPKEFKLIVNNKECGFKAPIEIGSLSQNSIMAITCVLDANGNVSGFTQAATTEESLQEILKQENDATFELGTNVTVTENLTIANNATIDLNGYKLDLTEKTVTISEDASMTISGTGTVIGYDPTNNVAEGYTAMDNSNGSYTIIPTNESLSLSLVANYPGLYTDNTNYYVYDAQGLISMRTFWADNWCGNSMWDRSYNIMADIKAEGYTWDNVWVNVGNNENNGFVLDGHNNIVTGLTINGSMFTGTPNSGNTNTTPGIVKDLTFDDITVVGDHWTAVLWGNTYGELNIENVHVINSEITGNCNVAAFIGGTAQESGDVTVNFKNCSVENTIITANGKEGQDPTGASVYLSRAFAVAKVTFENCTSIQNTITNKNGLVGGGIYGYTIWVNDGFANTGKCDSFTNWGGLSVVTENSFENLAVAINYGGNVILNDAIVDFEGKAGNNLNITEDVNIVGGTIKGTGWTGELNYAVNATSGTIVFEGVDFDTTDWTTVGWANWGISVNVNGTANVTFKKCNFKGSQCPIYQSGANSVITLEGCTFESTIGAIQCEIYSGDFSLGQNLIIKKCDFTGVADVLHIYDYDKNPSSEAIAQYLKDNGNIFTGTCKQTCE